VEDLRVRPGGGQEGLLQRADLDSLGRAIALLCQQSGMGERSVRVVNPGQVAVANAPVEVAVTLAYSQQSIVVLVAVADAGACPTQCSKTVVRMIVLDIFGTPTIMAAMRYRADSPSSVTAGKITPVDRPITGDAPGFYAPRRSKRR